MEPDPEPSFSVRLLQPFMRLLARDGRVPRATLAALPSDPEARLPVDAVMRLLDVAVTITKDPALGFRAAGEIDLGDNDLVEYAACSAPSWGEALEVLLRYIALLNDAGVFEAHTEGSDTWLVSRSKVPLHPAARDFQLAAVVVAARHWLGDTPEAKVCFRSSQPADPTATHRIAPAERLRFNAPCDAIIVPSRLLETPLGSDAKLHRLLRRQADTMLSTLPRSPGFVDQVEALICAALPSGTPNADAIAAALKMSRRTLARRLDRLATSFSDVAERARRTMAERYLRETTWPVTHVARALGYADAPTFSRAFKRWHGTSPGAFRANLRRDMSACLRSNARTATRR